MDDMPLGGIVLCDAVAGGRILATMQIVKRGGRGQLLHLNAASAA